MPDNEDTYIAGFVGVHTISFFLHIFPVFTVLSIIITAPIRAIIRQ